MALRRKTPGAEKTEVKGKTKKKSAASGSPPSVNQIEHWVSKIISFSSQYNSSGWSANQVIGEPKVYPRYGDLQGSWASQSYGREYIEVEFPEEVYIQRIHIYETYHGGAVSGIGAWNPLTRSYVSLYHAAPVVIKTSRIFEPDIEPTAFRCNRLRVDLDCTAAGTWCEIDAIKIIGQRHNLPPIPANSLSRDMSTLINSDLFSDVCFVVEKQNVYAHKAILVARSDYFRAMFTLNMKESTIEKVVLDDINYETFMAMIEYIYTGEVACSPVVTVDLLKLADMFSMNDLKLICMARIPEHLSVDTVLTVLDAVAEGDSLAVIRELCYEFIARNYAEITKSEQFHSLPREQILEIVQLTAEKLRLS